MRNFIINLICMASVISPAYAEQKIRDMSMSVQQTEEYMRKKAAEQEAINNNPNFGPVGNDYGTGYNNSVINSRSGQQIDNLINNTPLPPGVVPPPPGSAVAVQNYISNYCGSNYVQPQYANATQKNCQEGQRQQSCDRFANSPINVQRILSQAIDCELVTGDFDKSGCDGLDAGRLDLLKQYWQDQDISYNILFLPDLIINAAANCAAR